MNKRVIGLAGQVVWAQAIFIGVLLLFDDRIVVPVWLQAIGRMHPLILHFPIVILLLAMGMEAFRIPTVNSPNRAVTSELYGSFLTNLLLTGTLFAGITVIMGLFLSKEEGYSGQVVQWHKWTGVGIFFMSVLVYWSRNKAWYNAPTARLGALTTILCLIGAGHYGATLTHGDNFILEPVANRMKAAPVALDQAVVFANVIQPIFEQKCVSCHNAGKLKGELMLTDAGSIQKGGKSGQVFVAGKPDSSLFLQRIHLPPDEKKHMPPMGKAQLTPQEITLLSLWVKGKASFISKVVDLPRTDSLRIMASTLFMPSVPAEPAFDVEAADAETIKKLNNDYRTVAPLANGSPALAVNLYNRNAYTPEKLTELSDIKKQIVYLNLNKMPVNDADLKQIAQFENIQKLDLNFTNITGPGLRYLTPLTQLKTLAISGTNVNYTDLQKQISAFKGLKTVSIWNTRLTKTEMEQLIKANKSVAFMAGFDSQASGPIKLSAPQLKNPSTIFSKALPVLLKHPINGVEIRYTIDGTEPDSVTSPVYTSQTSIDKTTSLKVKAYKVGWYGSNTATFDFYQSTYKPDSVNLLFPLNPVHRAAGARTFFDRQLGTFNANSPAWANNWGGFKKNEMALVSEFTKPILVTSVSLRAMIEEATGIFPPAVIEIWGGNSRDQMTLLTTRKPAMPVEKSTPVLQIISCPIKPRPLSYLKIIARPVSKLPAWHPNKGKEALLLVDEVFIN